MPSSYYILQNCKNSPFLPFLEYYLTKLKPYCYRKIFLMLLRDLLAGMGKADLHIHTSYSYDSSCTVPAVLEWAANCTDLDVIAITDHDAYGGAQEAMQIAPRFGIQVIPGCEVTTSQGHLLALYIEHPIPPGRSMLETVLRVGEQGGLCIAAHPTAFLAHGVDGPTLRSLLQDADAHQVMVGVETWNTGVFYQGSNHTAQRIQAEVGLASIGSSDSHVVWTVGFGYTEFSGRTAQDLRCCLQAHATTAHRRFAHRGPDYWPRHVFSRLLRKLGWVTWTPEPNASFKLRRLADVQLG
jgi:predicted metal-dependent phosphoesterase TrpH